MTTKLQLTNENKRLREENENLKSEYENLSDCYCEIENKYADLQNKFDSDCMIKDLNRFKWRLTMDNLLTPELENFIEYYMRYHND
jgi:predicted nuclease with TOPRIM domain